MTCCCNITQTASLITIGVALVICLFAWSSIVLAPIKLVVVFLHEISHALAAICTGGRIKGIEINENYGGLTLTQGGNRCVTLTAGYIGSVLWGSLFLLLSVTRDGRYVGASLFIAACFFAPFTLRIRQKKLGCRMGIHLALALSIWALGALVVGFWIWRDRRSLKVDPLRVTMMCVGTICSLHAVYDVTHDTLFHKINNQEQGKSDAVMLAEEVTGSARCWGLIWTLISLFVFCLVLWAVLAIDQTCNSSSIDDSNSNSKMIFS